MIQEFELALPNTRETFEFLANETEGTGWYIIDETTEQVVIAFESQHMYTRALQELPQL